MRKSCLLLMFLVLIGIAYSVDCVCDVVNGDSVYTTYLPSVGDTICYIDNSLAIFLPENGNPDSLKYFLQSNNCEILDQLYNVNAWIVHTDDTVDLLSFISVLNSKSYVDSAYLDVPVSASFDREQHYMDNPIGAYSEVTGVGLASDCDIDVQYAQAMLNNADGDDYPADRNAKIAIFDTGIAWENYGSYVSHSSLYHPFRDGLISLHGVYLGSAAPGEIPVDDFTPHGHGTAVAGLIGGMEDPENPIRDDKFTGVCPGVTMQIFKTLNSDGFGASVDVLRALDHALEGYKPHVINCSWGANRDSGILREFAKISKDNDIYLIDITNQNSK